MAHDEKVHLEAALTWVQFPSRVAFKSLKIGFTVSCFVLSNNSVMKSNFLKMLFMR